MLSPHEIKTAVEWGFKTGKLKRYSGPPCDYRAIKGTKRRPQNNGQSNGNGSTQQEVNP